MSQSQEFQQSAATQAHTAANHLRRAADKLEHAFTGDPLAQDGWLALEAMGTAVWSAQACLGHAIHQHTLAILHREREKK